MDYKIDFSSLYNSDEAFFQDIAKVETDLEKLKKYKGHLFERPQQLQEALQLNFQCVQMLEKIMVYGRVPFDLAIEDEKANRLYAAASACCGKADGVTAFLIPEIMEQEKEVIIKFQEDPVLKDYRVLLQNLLRSKEHQATMEEEQLLSDLGEVLATFSNNQAYIIDSELVYRKIKGEDGKMVALTSSNYSKYIRSPKRSIRKAAYLARREAVRHSLSSLASNYIAHIKTDEIVAKKYHFSSSFAMSLFQDAMCPEVYEKLCMAYQKGMPLFKKGLKLRKKALGVKTLMGYDLTVPLEKVQKDYSYDQAMDIMKSACAVYGKNYCEKLDYLLNQKTIDVEPVTGKYTGWYSYSIYNWHPIILANYDRKFSDVSALAHELGHSVNAMYRFESHRFPYSGQSFTDGEVPSLTNEILVSRYMLEHSEDKEEKRAILYNLLHLFENNFFDAMMGSAFERAAHEEARKGHVLTKEVLNELFQKEQQKLYGREVQNVTAYNWSTVPHFYESYYYFRYAIGICGAFYAADRLVKDPAYLEKYMAFLKTGSDKLPLENLRVADIDLERGEVFERALDVYQQFLTEFENLV